MERLNIGIVGSGIAGLSAAWMLGRYHHVTLFEKHPRPGMGAFNLDFSENGIDARIDVPLRAFNSCHYTNLFKLYKELGVAMRSTDHSAAYANEDLQKSFFAYRYLGWRNRAVPVLRGLNKFNVKTMSIVKDAIRFTLTAKRDIDSGSAKHLTILNYLKEKSYSEAFIYDVVLPSFAAICTCSYDAVSKYPAETIIEFWTSGLLFNGIWRAKFGADDAINRLLEHCDEISCDTNIKQVFERKGKVVVHDDSGRELVFDHVVMATQANQAKQFLSTQQSDIVALLDCIKYERSEVVVHSDESLLPKKESDRAPVNFMIDRLASAPMASIWLNKIYPELEKAAPVFQTWNPLRQPREATVLGRASFERPIVTLESLEAIKKLNSSHQNPEQRIWFCGSYAMPGIPLLESAVQSAMTISERLDAPAPWA